MASGCLPSVCCTWTGWKSGHYHDSDSSDGLDKRYQRLRELWMTVPEVGQKRLVLVGASGMVGGYALRHALDDGAVGSVTSIGRKELGISHPKLQQVGHRD